MLEYPRKQNSKKVKGMLLYIYIYIYTAVVCLVLDVRYVSSIIVTKTWSSHSSGMSAIVLPSFDQTGRAYLSSLV